jgi:opacity protein-like surface antigen
MEAQNRRVEFGAFAGASYYVGDLNPGMPFREAHPAFGGLLRYAMTDRWAVKGAITLGEISGSYSPNRTLYPNTGGQDYSFQKTILDIAGTFEFNFLSYDHPFITKTKFTPYLALGLAGALYNRAEVQNGQTQNGKVFILSLPFGAGVKYKLNDWIRIGAEWTMRKTFTDDLDVNGSLTGLDASDPYGFNKKSTAHNNDWYSFAGVSVSFSLFKRKSACNAGYR